MNEKLREEALRANARLMRSIARLLDVPADSVVLTANQKPAEENGTRAV